jgi:hypothetical protein
MSTRIAGYLAAMLLILANSAVDAGEVATGEPGQFSLGTDVAVYAGIANADIGGVSANGAAVGVFAYAVPFNEHLKLRLGFEYSQKVNTGEVVRYNSGDNSLIYQGGGEVTLQYLQLPVELTYIQKFSSWAIAPHAGFAPALIVGQSVSTDLPSGSTFSNFDWYRSSDVVALAGLTVQYRRLLVDFQASAGLLKLKSTEVRAPGDWPGVPFGGANGKSSSFRVGMGLAL